MARGEGVWCPRCRAATLVDNTIHRCTSCQGAWIPESLIEARIGGELAWASAVRDPIACGVCAAPMETLTLLDVPLDRCRIHGVWFDANELDQVVGKSQPEKERAGRTILDTVIDLFWRY